MPLHQSAIGVGGEGDSSVDLTIWLVTHFSQKPQRRQNHRLEGG